MNELTFGFYVALANFERLLSKHEPIPAISLWALWMFSYRQDAGCRSMGWLILSQMVAITALIGLAVFGFTDREWWNFILLPVLVWLHVEFTRRWWARPDAWW
jgi:hypothetical protein